MCNDLLWYQSFETLQHEQLLLLHCLLYILSHHEQLQFNPMLSQCNILHFRLDPSTSLSHSFAFIWLNLSHFPLHISDILKVSSHPDVKGLIPNFITDTPTKMCTSFCCYWNHQVYSIQEIWYILKNIYKLKLEKLTKIYVGCSSTLMLAHLWLARARDFL